MKSLVKPTRLNPGDKVATVSLSAGTAGDPPSLWRYHQGKRRIEELLGLSVVEMPHTLAGSAYNSLHPEARAADLMAAFADPSIKAIVSCIGGIDTVRLLPYIDFDIIRDNPKVFMGYSDTTVNHYMCYKAGLSSIYGPAVLSDFAENVAMPSYTLNFVKRTLFSAEPIGQVPPAPNWCSDRLEWVISNKDTTRQFRANTGYELIQGTGVARGRLIGGCLEAFIDLEAFIGLSATELFPPASDFAGTILFFETSGMQPPAREGYPVEIGGKPGRVKSYLEMLRSLGELGILAQANGMVIGKPVGEKYFTEYQIVIKQVLAEYGRSDLPVLYNLSFGHCEPKFCLPYGAMAEIDCANKTFSILESAVH